MAWTEAKLIAEAILDGFDRHYRLFREITAGAKQKPDESRLNLLARNIAHSDEQHEAILVAILAGDADSAGVAMLAHIGGTAALLHGFLD
jgi:isocitrate dehydrogenase kinase/phosphatase